MNPQFRTLVAHFFSRFFDVEGAADETAARTRTIQLMALVAVPGLMMSFFLMSDHPSVSIWGGGATQAQRPWLRVGDRYVFVAYAMVVMGLLVTFKWDSLFPDRRDYLILSSLPITAKRWFTAKVAALCCFLLFFIVAVNAFSLLTIPGLVARQSRVQSQTVYFEALLAHAAGTLGGSLFAALFFGALQGVLINVLSAEAFRRISVRIQTISIAVLVSLLLVVPLAKEGIPLLARSEHPFLDYFPLMWFLGLYETLIPGGSVMPRSIVWAYTAVQATAVVAVVFAASYVVGYRRRSRKILESNPADALILRWWKTAAEAVLGRTLLRHPVERGTFHFIEKIAVRSRHHQILTALYVGVGIALAASSLFLLDRRSVSTFPFRLSPRGALEAPIILTFVLIVGLRATFKAPYEIAANWLFQTAGDGQGGHFLKAVRKWVFLYRIVPLFAVVAVFEFALFDAITASAHLSFDLVMAAVLVEVFVFSFDKVPFTCVEATGKIQMAGLAAGYLFAFTAYVGIVGAIKGRITASPLRTTLFIAVVSILLVLIAKRRRSKAVVYSESEELSLSLSADRGYWQNARAVALVRLGSREALWPAIRRGFRGLWTDAVEFRRGVRILWKSPGLSATAVVLIALVIGGNTTIFSMVHAFITRPAPGVSSTDLVVLGDPSTRGEPFHSYPEFIEIAAQTQTMRSLIAWGPERITFVAPDGTSAMWGAYVTPNYFEGLGVRLQKGRGFTEADNRTDASGLPAVISHRVWQEQFHGAEDVLGRTVTINGLAASVLGVAAEYFHGAELAIPEDVWVPVVSYFTLHGRRVSLTDRDDIRRPFGVMVIGQLASGVSLEEARAEFATISSRLQTAFPVTHKDRVIRPIQYTATTNAGISHFAPQFLAIFSVITAMTLIVVCANVANLLLARAVVRERETALRRALGASRKRIVWMLMGEGVALSVASWAAAVVFSAWVTRTAPRFVLSQTMSPIGMRPNHMNMDLSPDWTVLAYAMLLAMFGTIFFTLAPAVRTWKQELLPGLRTGEHSVARGRSMLGSGLVVTQLAFSVVLLTGAAHVHRSLTLLDETDFGFETANLLMVTVNPTLSITNRETGLQTIESLRERLHAVPGVDAVSYVRRPFGINWNRLSIPTDGQTPILANLNHIGPDYLRTLGAPPIAGREFAPDERLLGRKSAIVNEALARAIWPGQSPIGQTIPLQTRDVAEVVGVAPNLLYAGRDYEHVLFLSEQQDVDRVTGLAALAESGENTFYVRYRGSLDVVARGVRQTVREVDERVPIVQMRTLTAHMENVNSNARMVEAFLWLFSGGSLLIAALGQYAAIAFEMKRRNRELGIRVALGASAQQIQSSVLKEGLALTGIGLLIGFGLSAVVGFAFRALLTGVTPTPLTTYMAGATLLAVVSFLACYLPARRASRVDPLVTLRYE
jgi:predicted permease